MPDSDAVFVISSSIGDRAVDELTDYPQDFLNDPNAAPLAWFDEILVTVAVMKCGAIGKARRQSSTVSFHRNRVPIRNLGNG